MKGYGIFVGVNKVDSNHYMNEHEFEGAKTNAVTMRDIAVSTNSYDKDNINLLTDKDAKWVEVKALLKKYARKSRKEDEPGYLILTFSGHGFSFSGFDKNHSHLSDILKREEPFQFLCFYDQMVPENHIREILTRFSKKFKIVIIVDSCYSDGISTSSRGGNSKRFFIPQDDIRGIIEDRNASQNLPNYLRKYVGKYQKVSDKKKCKIRISISCKSRPVTFINVLENNLGFYSKKIRQYPNNDRWNDYKADILYYNACKSNQVALRGKNGKPSNFTEYFKLVWENGSGFSGNYFQLNDLLKEGLQRKHSPVVRHNEDFPSDFFSKTVPIAFEKNYDPESVYKDRWKLSLSQEYIDCSPEINVRTIHKDYKFINYLYEDKKKNIDIREVKMYIRQMSLEASSFVIIQISIHNGKHVGINFSETLNKLKIIKKDNEGKGTLYFLYDFDRSRVVSHCKSDYLIKQ